AFVAQVTARTQRARLARPGETARTFTITIAAAGPKTRGRLTIDDPPRPPPTRDVTGDTRHQVVSPPRLPTPPALDPTAPRPPPPPPPPPPAPPPPPSPPAACPPPTAPLPGAAMVGPDRGPSPCRDAADTGVARRLGAPGRRAERRRAERHPRVQRLRR